MLVICLRQRGERLQKIIIHETNDNDQKSISHLLPIISSVHVVATVLIFLMVLIAILVLFQFFVLENENRIKRSSADCAINCDSNRSLCLLVATTIWRVSIGNLIVLIVCCARSRMIRNLQAVLKPTWRLVRFCLVVSVSCVCEKNLFSIPSTSNKSARRLRFSFYR